MSEIEYTHGRLVYRRKSTGEERGREDWQLTANRDGSLTMRCLAMTDDSRFVRDVTCTLGAGRDPVDAFVRLQVGTSHVGTGYFRGEGRRLIAVCDASATGHTVQTIEMPGHFHILTHAVMLDGWSFWHYDFERNGAQDLIVYNTSPMWDGTSGPLGRVDRLIATCVGLEEVAVPAGKFPARHFRLDSEATVSMSGGRVPTSDLWITGRDNILVRYDWEGMDLEYVLASMERESFAVKPA